MGQIIHGIELACYSNGHSGYLPVMECSCGFSTEYGNVTWEEAGAEYDRHIAAVMPEIVASEREAREAK